MKKIFTSLLLFVASLTLSAQGWPANYDGVMLQGFYWDSYSDSKWSQLTSQAEELSQYFKLIWVPNSGKTDAYYSSKSNTMGYDPCFWLDHESCWGTEAQLKEMITTFKDKGTGIIEDVVINHKNGRGSWVHFPDETKGSYSVTWDNTNSSGICKTDECNQKGYTTTGADDTGDDFPGYRDLDHTNATVQQNVKTYLKYLLNELGYVRIQFALFGQSCISQITATKNASYFISIGVWIVGQIELGMQGFCHIEFYAYLIFLQLGRKTT